MRNLPSLKTDSTHSLREREAHREWIGGRVLTLLSHFWREDDPIALTAALGQDWADVLEGYPQEYIQRACVQYLREETRKPKPADIIARVQALMPKPRPVEPTPEPERERVSETRAAEIMEEIGFLPENFNLRKMS